MEILLTDDQEFFRDTTRKFLGSEASVAKVRALHSSAAGFERDYWRQGAELGWVSLLVPEEHGGGSVSGHGAADLAHQQGELLPALIAGEQVATWAVTELPPHDALGDLTLRAEADGGGFVLSGVKSPVEAGAEADALLVTATGDAGLSQFLVPTGAHGLTVTPLKSIDMTRRYARITFDGVRVDTDAVVGALGGAGDDVEQQIRIAAVVQSAEMIGAADTLFAMTLEWVFDRYSFGRPLASYQEIKHRFADLKTWLETSHALADHAARQVSTDASDAALLASAAKAYAGDHLADLAQDAVQLHGGIGVTYESDVHLYLRRITADRLTYGTPADHRRRIGAHRAADAA
jgi:alkylation response protein AidB-like acyl-CoA dehydrogenase